jgi:cell division ATPase FtsA
MPNAAMRTRMNLVSIRRTAQPGSRPEYLSLVDFGAGSVKAAVVRREEGAVRLLGYGIAPSEGVDLTGGRAAVAALRHAVDQALVAAEDQTEHAPSGGSPARGKIVPDDAIFGLSARLTQGRSFSIHQSRPEVGAPITARELKATWERVERTARDELTQLDQDGDRWQPLAVAPGITMVDGRQVTDPVGMKGQVLSLSAFGVAVWPAVLRAASAVAKHLEVALLDVAADIQTLAALVPQREAILIDIGLKGTTLGLIRHDRLVATRGWTQGGAYFTSALSEAFCCPAGEAEGLKRAYADGSLSSRDGQLVARALAAPLAGWFESFIVVLGQLAEDDITRTLAPPGFKPPEEAGHPPDHALPGHIYLTGGGSCLPGLAPALAAVEMVPRLRFRRAVEIESLGRNLGAHLPRPGRGLPNRPTLLDVPAQPVGDLLAPVLSLATCVES